MSVSNINGGKRDVRKPSDKVKRFRELNARETLDIDDLSDDDIDLLANIPEDADALDNPFQGISYEAYHVSNFGWRH